MTSLLRDQAPFSAAVWREIDEEATRVLKLMLGARKLIDFEGPLGWNASAIPLGRIQPIVSSPAEGVACSLRQVQPLVEFRVGFALSRAEIDAIERGAKDPDLDPVTHAAQAMARAEDRSIFHGYADAGITGIAEAAADRTLSLSEDYTTYPEVVVQALATLRTSGIDGPYGIALGPRCYEGLNATTEGGYPIIDHVRELIGGPMVWAPSINGAVVLSLRGGDFEMSVGRDIAIGYRSHTESDVTLFMEESLTFRVLTPEAAVPLAYA